MSKATANLTEALDQTPTDGFCLTIHGFASVIPPGDAHMCSSSRRLQEGP